MIDVSGLRRVYAEGGLSRKDLTEEPVDLFEKWLKQAIDSGMPDPTGMVVSTVDGEGQPSSRMVLLKNYDRKSLVFFTNYGSRKAMQWFMLERQVAFLGHAEKLTPVEVMKYFTSRPRDSQIGAWTSHQSSRISARAALESKFMELKQKFSKGEIPVPTFWGGFRVFFHSVEFWQGRPSRLHDRFIYERNAAGGWDISRLAP